MTRPGPTPQQPYRAARAGRGLLATLVGVLLVLAGIVVGAVPAAAQNAVGASTLAAANTVGPPAGIGAGQRLGKTVPQPQIVVATAVAAETESGVGSALVKYDPEWASRELLGQNAPGSTGYGVTPGGRTVSVHAAERIILGGPGRPPTSLSTVDDILDTGTSVRFDPMRDSIQVRAPLMPGKPYVVVDSAGTHVVTVMVPK